MLKRLTYEEVYNRFEKTGLILLDKEYIKNSTRMNCMDKFGYKYCVSLMSITSGSFPEKFIKFNPFKKYNIQHFLDLESNGSKLINIDNNDSKKGNITITCEKCGKIITKKHATIINGKSFLCDKCIPNSRKYKNDYIREEFKKHGYTILEEYKANNVPILCIDEEGYRVKLSYVNINKSPYKFSSIFNMENYLYNANILLKNLGFSNECTAIKILDEKYGIEAESQNVIIAKCSCGNNFRTNISSIKHGQIRCNECSKLMSKGEFYISKWLDKYRIDYIQQYKFKDCKDIRPLPFDFYLPKYNCCIECDGTQHYFASVFSKSSDPIKNLEYIKRHDEIKNKYCKDNNIDLLRLSYNDIRRLKNNYKEILLNKFIKK